MLVNEVEEWLMKNRKNVLKNKLTYVLFGGTIDLNKRFAV